MGRQNGEGQVIPPTSETDNYSSICGHHSEFTISHWAENKKNAS